MRPRIRIPHLLRDPPSNAHTHDRLTGSSDGIVRVVQLHPNKLLGVVGAHDDFPVERMRYSRDRQLLGTSSHDNVVRMWEVGFLFEPDDAEGDDAMAEGGAAAAAAEGGAGGGAGKGKGQGAQIFGAAGAPPAAANGGGGGGGGGFFDEM